MLRCFVLNKVPKPAILGIVTLLGERRTPGRVPYPARCIRPPWHMQLVGHTELTLHCRYVERELARDFLLAGPRPVKFGTGRVSGPSRSGSMGGASR
jgi:hypothetical protein